MEQAYFKNIKREIIPYLNDAKQEVVVAMAWFTSSELFQALIDCLRRNVSVELVLLDNASNFMYYAPDFNEFINAGGILHIANPEHKFMHHKFCVIDQEIVVTGSYNWTYYAETRNIENILISDRKEIIDLYIKEFRELASRFGIALSSPRIEWEDICAYDHIDFDDLNFEIEEIAKARDLPQRKILKTNTSVTIEERPINPVSRYNIGVKVNNNKSNTGFLPIIPKGAKLPFTSELKTLYTYKENRNNVRCVILCDKKDSKGLIAQRPLTDIIADRNDDELTIQIQFTLVQSGDLVAEIRCIETGKVLTVRTTNMELVKYED